MAEISRRMLLRGSLLGAAGLAVPYTLRPGVWGLPGGINPLSAHAMPPSGMPLLIVVHADGGWDPTMIFDPKGERSTLVDGVIVPDLEGVNRYYHTSEILQTGAIRHAPDFDIDSYVETFMARYASRLMVVNGVNMTTNGHETGTQYAARGSSGSNPVLGAMYAGTFGPSLPMTFMASGFTETLGVVPVSASGNADLMIRAAYPDLKDPYGDPTDGGNRYFPASVDALIDGALLEQITEAALNPAQGLPLEDYIALRDNYLRSSGSSSDLVQLRDNLPSEADLATNPFPSNTLLQQAIIPIAAYKSGLCQACQLTTGGFDTHGNHDISQDRAISGLLQGVDGIVVEAERQGVPVVIAITSEFGRTPGYNSGAGKDHHPVTSFAFIGQGVPGGRVVGGTTYFQRNLHVTANLDLLPEGEAGIEITSDEIHLAVRSLLGIGGTSLDQRYPLASASVLPIFTA